MADLATLGIAVETRGAAKAAGDLDRVGKSSKRAAAGADKAEREFRRLSAAADRLKQRLSPLTGGIAKMAAGFAGLAAAGAAVKTIVSFEQTMANVAAVSKLGDQSIRANAEAFAQLEAAARKAGATTKFSATEAAEAQLFLARAGLQSNEIIGALPATLNLAAAGALDLGRAADISSNVMSQFTLAASDLEGVVDVLAVTANSSNTSVEQLGEAFAYAGPVAAGFGQSVESTASALGILGNAGIQASAAGTNLRGVILRLANPVGQTKKAFEGLGIALSELDPTQLSIEEIFTRLKRAQEAVGTEEFAKQASAAFGRLNAAAAIALTNASGDLVELKKATDDANGAAKEMARVQSDTVSGAFKTLKSAIEEVFIATGEGGLRGSLRGIIDVSTEVVRILARIDNGGKEFSRTAQIMANAVRALAAAMAAMVAVKLVSFFATLASAVRAAALSFRVLRVAMLGTGIGLVVAGVSLLAGEFGTLGGETSSAADSTADFNRQLERSRERLEEAQERASSYAASLKAIADAERQGDLSKEASARFGLARTAGGFADELRRGAAANPQQTFSGEDLVQRYGRRVDFSSLSPQLAGLAEAFRGAREAEAQLAAVIAERRRFAEQVPLIETAEQELAARSIAERVSAANDAYARAIAEYYKLRDSGKGLTFTTNQLIDFFDGLESSAREAAAETAKKAAAAENEIEEAAKKIEAAQARIAGRAVDALTGAVGGLLGGLGGDGGSGPSAFTGRLRELQASNATRAGLLGSPNANAEANLQAQLRSARQGLLEDGALEIFADGAVAALERELRAAQKLDQQYADLAASKAKAQRVDEAESRLKDILSDYEFEAELIGKSNEERARMIALREANAIALEDESGRLKSLVPAIGEAAAAAARLREQLDKQAEKESWLDKYLNEESIKRLSDGLAGSFTDAFGEIIAGTKSVEDAFQGMLRAISQMLLQELVLSPLQGALSSGIQSLIGGATTGLFAGGSASGNAFRSGNVIPFASGGVVGGPTFFPMAGGRVGLMGEAGAEAIMPLKRGANGKLGVQAEGGARVDQRTINVKLVLPGVQNPEQFRKSRRQIAEDLRAVTGGI
jgi:TP901 family phage tail tape measure protein